MNLKFLLSSLLVLMACSEPPKSVEIPELTYKFTPIFEDDQTRLDIELTFTGDADGTTDIRRGGRWSRDSKAGTRFRQLTVSGGAAKLQGDVYQPNLTITHDPSAELIITYSLSSEDMHDASTDIEYFYVPVLQPDVIHLIGSTSLVVPMPETRGQAYNVDIQWEGLPEDWREANTLPNRPISNGEITSSVFIVAPSESLSRVSGAYELNILQSGTHAFSRDDFKKEMVEIFEGQNTLWQSDQSKYLITLLGTPESANYSAFTGTGRFNSFASAASPDLELDFLVRFLSHEVTHNWMPGKLGKWPGCDEGDSCPPKISWFSEGFTDFVMTRAMLAEGRWTQADLVEFTNQYLRSYYLSPAKTATGHEIDKLFWEDFEHERQPYWRGFLLAMNWDDEIKRNSDGKMTGMDVLRNMYEIAKAAKDDRPVLTQDYIAQAFSDEAGRDVLGDVKQFYDEGGELKPHAGLFLGCAELGSASAFAYDVGFDAQATLGSGIVSGVAEGHNAAKAGLKNGQSLVAKVSGGGGDTAVPLVLEVQESGKNLTISYVPVSGKPMMVPYFEKTGDCL